MDFLQLKSGTRYLFYQKNKDGPIKYFRANYLGIFVWKKYTTLVVCNYENDESKINKKVIHYIMDSHNIINAVTLVDILKNKKCKLNNDVLNEINIFY